MSKFHVGKPATPDSIIDRDAETKYLISKMSSKQISYNIAVLGYRRIGKTSILLKAKNVLDKKPNLVVVYFDVKQNMSQPRLFLTRLQGAIFDAYIKKQSHSMTKVKDKTSKILANMSSALSHKDVKSIGINLGADGTITPKIEIKEKESEYSKLFLSIFQSASIFAEKHKLKFVIILDEFQDLEDLERYPDLKKVFSLFRSAVQNRGKLVSFIISGSRVHTAKAILGSGESPLFLHFEHQMIEEMDRNNSVVLFNHYLKARKIKHPAKIGNDAYKLVGGHPFYLMALAENWDKDEEITETYNRILTKPFGALKLYCEYLLSEDLSSIVGGALLRTILRAVSDNDEGYSYSEIAKKIDYPMTRLPRYIKALIDADLLAKANGKFLIRDRIVRDYLRIESQDLF